jgi:hypothetical protein
MCDTPSTAMAAKPDQRDRAEKLADAAVPRFARQTAKQNHQRERNHACLKVGDTTSRPSTADSTEMAGVMTPSP